MPLPRSPHLVAPGRPGYPVGLRPVSPIPGRPPFGPPGLRPVGRPAPRKGDRRLPPPPPKEERPTYTGPPRNITLTEGVTVTLVDGLLKQT